MTWEMLPVFRKVRIGTDGRGATLGEAHSVGCRFFDRGCGSLLDGDGDDDDDDVSDSTSASASVSRDESRLYTTRSTVPQDLKKSEISRPVASTGMLTRKSVLPSGYIVSWDLERWARAYRICVEWA